SDIMTNMIKNLGTDADLFFNQTGDGSPLQYITVGAGTPWKGLSSSVGEGWVQGTIYANSDFWLQGHYRLGSAVALNLGRPSTSNPNTGSYAIINQAGRPINVFVSGQVVLNEDTPVQMSGDITFVITSDGYLQPNWANSFGDLERFGSRAKVLVQAGGTLDPGNYVPIYPYQDSPDYPAYYGKQYPLPSPVNTDVVVEAGGRFLINDASGIGSTTGGAKWLMKTGSILDLGTANAFFGSYGYDPNNPAANTGLIAPGQFVFEPGVIVRLGADNIYKLSQFVTAEPNGNRVIYEVFGGSRYVTNQVNPFIPPQVGVVRNAPETIRIGQGGMITNDSVDRRWEESRGQLILEDGAILAATTQTILYIKESVRIPAGATVTIGLPQGTYIDGNPKYGGAVWFDGLHSNWIEGGQNALFWVMDGGQLGLAQRNCFPDTATVHLESPVTNWTPAGAWAAMPGNGSTLLLRTSWFTEVIGPLTGSGGVLTDQDGAWLATGWGATSDFTFAGVFSSTGGRQPNLEKIGPSTMYLTGSSTSTGEMRVNQGAIVLTGASGRVDFGTVRVGKTGRLVLDNSTQAVNNRLDLGVPAGVNVAGQGGVLELVGGASAVTETVSTLWNGGSPSGSKTYLNITPGTGTTTFVATTIESYVSGGRNATWVFRTPTIANLPIGYNADNTYTVPAGNLTNGLIRSTNPNFWISSGVAQPGGTTGIAGAAGTPVAPSRGDLLGEDPATGTIGFVTQDVNNDSSVGFRLLQPSEYAPYIRPNMRTNMNVWLPAGVHTVSGNTEIRLLRMSPGAVLDITGVVPLTNSPSQLAPTAPGILVDAGGTATIRGTYLNSCWAPNASLYFHTYGDLNMEAQVFTWNSLVKTGPGKLTFAPGTATVWRGSLVVDEGTVELGPNNTFRPWPSQHRWNASSLYLNGGVLNLGDNSQMIGDLQSVNWLPYGAAAGGTLTATSPVTLTITGGGTFSGQITGPVSIVKYGNTTQYLTNVNPMTGSLTIRQGYLYLRDEGRLPNITGPINLEYAALRIENSYLVAAEDRLPAGVDLVMRGGDFIHQGRAGTVTKVFLDEVTLAAGRNMFQTEAGGGGASETYIQNLVRPAGSYSMVDFRQNYGWIGTPGNDTTAIRYMVQNVNGVPIDQW
ncbi:MAG TPA: autotransporter-associated beta strand repeat-containing protein, partial [Thermoguttaceae bacterium]|nr:autotransporter-associated beta strand repeat-containing protein [Thermoguttaceae bacterium]